MKQYIRHQFQANSPFNTLRRYLKILILLDFAIGKFMDLLPSSCIYKASHLTTKRPSNVTSHITSYGS
jgi:hypothetical protein